MTSPGPHAVTARIIAARIKAETGIDVLDMNAAAAAAKVAMRRTWRQIAGTFGGSLVSTVALLCFLFVFAPGNASLSPRIAVALVGAGVTAAAVTLIVWGWRTTAVYTELCIKRQEAWQRYYAETGRPCPSLFADADWLTQKAMIAFSTPSEVRAMRKEASRQPQPQNPEHP